MGYDTDRTNNPPITKRKEPKEYDQLETSVE